jgi:hypothetical protein
MPATTAAGNAVSALNASLLTRSSQLCCRGRSSVRRRRLTLVRVWKRTPTLGKVLRTRSLTTRHARARKRRAFGNVHYRHRYRSWLTSNNAGIFHQRS